jgi:cysteine desulfuration protein SufE
VTPDHGRAGEAADGHASADASAGATAGATAGAAAIPRALAEIVESFAMLPPRDRLELLLEYAGSIPPLPERYAAHPELLEPVPECQSPLFVAAEVDAQRRVQIFVSAPAEAPTTRGFAGIFHAGLNGLPADEVLAVPGDITARLSLSDVVSPLRLRGAAALLGRVQHQVRAQLA